MDVKERVQEQIDHLKLQSNYEMLVESNNITYMPVHLVIKIFEEAIRDEVD